MAKNGIVFNIQRHSIHDGPGIRTILFFKGCPLACKWCSNPESQAFAPELSFNPEKCIACGACLRVCPSSAIVKEAGGLVFHREACVSCGLCADVCYAEARVMEGREMTADDAVDEVCKDEAFFRRSGGGLTLGGGEPLAQAEFAEAVLRGVRERGITTAVETAGHVPWENFERLIPLVDYFLFDIKHTDAAKHKIFIGSDNLLIQRNLEKLAAAHPRIIARTPVIPGFNDSEEDLFAAADRAAALGIREIHFLPYHRYGSGKYGLLGKIYPLAGEDSMTTSQITARLEGLKEAIAGRGPSVHIGG